MNHFPIIDDLIAACGRRMEEIGNGESLQPPDRGQRAMTADGQSVELLLRQTPFLQALSSDDLAKVAGIASIEQHEPETVLFQEGSRSDRLYLVTAGLVALDMCMPRRGCVRILTVGPREIVGWSALLSNTRMTARATVVEAATFLVFPAQQLRGLCDTDHDVGYVVMQQIAAALSQRLVATRLQMLDVFGETQPTVQHVT